MYGTNPLSRRQQRFVQEYLVDANATQAAIRAGYYPHTAKQQGSRLLTNVDVQAAVADGIVALAESAGIDAEWVIRQLVHTYQRAESDGQLAVAVRALELLGRRYSLFVDQRHLTVEHLRTGRDHRLTACTTDQLRAMADRMDPDALPDAPPGAPKNVVEGEFIGTDIESR